MPPKKPLPADTGGVKKPVRTGKITGATPVKERIRQIEKTGSKEDPKTTGVQQSKEKVGKKPSVKASRRLSTVQEGMEEKDWNWETPQKHSTPKSEGARKEVKEAVGINVEHPKYESSQPWPFPSSLMLGFHATASNTEICCNPEELLDARWFDAKEIMAFKEWDSAVDDEPRLPRRDSIARWLLQSWLDGLALS